MDQNTFAKIMCDVFIPHVKRVRETVEGNKHAALIVDGHISRYCLPCLEMFIQHDMDLVILPAHTSHVAQPLDLGLNHHIKSRFREEFPKAHPIIPLEEPRVGRPPSKKRRRTATADEQQMVPSPVLCGSNTVSQYRVEDPEDTEARVRMSVYRRAKIVEALLISLQRALTYSNITSSWRQSHLFPLQDDPPYTKAKEEELIKSVLSAHLVIPVETERKKEHITGIVTRPTEMEKIKARPDLMKPAVRIHKRGRRPSVTTPAVPVQEDPATHPTDQTSLSSGTSTTSSEGHTAIRPSKIVKRKRKYRSKHK